MSVQAVSETSPAGFGSGRRTNRITVVQAAFSNWRTVPRNFGQGVTSEDLDPWTRDAAQGFLSVAEGTLFDLCWRFWLKDQTLEEFAASIASWGTDAVVLLALRRPNLALVPALAQMDVPIVLAYGRTDDPRIAWVACDNAGGTAKAVRHLAALGHQRIAFMATSTGLLDHEERQVGYSQGLASLRLPEDPRLIVESPLDGNAAERKAAAASLLRLPDRPTAVVCANDLAAIGVVDAAWEMGLRVPDDVAVTGFDNSDDAIQTVPQLTTLSQPVAAISATAYYLAACAAVGQQPEGGSWQVELPVSMVVRSSCGASRAAGDVPEQAQSKREVESVRRELELRVRQLAAMNQEMQDFLNVASHDLRAPLITIEGFAVSLQRRYGALLDERGRHHLQRIRDTASDLEQLTDALLHLSREQNEPLSITPVRLADVLHDVLRDLDAMVQEKRARIRVDRRLPTVLADRMALTHIFSNLIANALRYMGNQPNPLVSVRHELRREEHEFSVSDNGIGIPLDQQDEIFKPFRRLSDTGVDGAGIGLTTVKRWVLRHGGRIWVESEKAKGATFRFTLPRSRAELAGSALPADSA